MLQVVRVLEVQLHAASTVFTGFDIQRPARKSAAQVRPHGLHLKAQSRAFDRLF